MSSSNDTMSSLSILNGTLNSQFSNSTGDNVTLVGSHFKNPLFLASIVIVAVCAAAFIVLTIASWLKKADFQGSRRAFAVMMTLLVGMTSAFIRTFLDNMVHEYQLTVPKAYLILPSLKPVLDNATDVGLIAMVYRIIKNRNRWVCGDLTGYLWWQRAHSFVVYILIILAIADTALYIYAEVLLFGLQVDQLIDPRLAKAANSYKEVHLTYNALYLVTTIEIMGCAVFILWRARAQKLKSRASHSSMIRPKQRAKSLMLTTFLQIMTYLLLLVEPFLILRSTALLVVAVLYAFEARTEAHETTVIEVALWGFPSIFIFTGLVLIQYRKDWEPDFRYTYHEVPVHGPVMQAADGAAPWPQNQNTAWKEPVVQRYYSP